MINVQFGLITKTVNIPKGGEFLFVPVAEQG